MSQKFIMVKTKEERQKLAKLGLQEVNKTHDGYFFLNEPKKITKFNKNELNLIYTNKLMF